MSSNDSNGGRRRLLKALGAGGGVVVAQKSLPGEWARPVVESVLLPAHAQTTETNDDAAPSAASCVVPLAVKSVACVDADVNDVTYYQIRTAATPCGFEVIDAGPGPSQPARPWVSVAILKSGGNLLAGVTSSNAAGSIVDSSGGTFLCGGSIPAIDTLPIAAIDEVGNCYRIDGTITADPSTGATISGLTVSATDPGFCP